MKIELNGQSIELAETDIQSISLLALITKHIEQTEHCAVAINNEIVPRSLWSETPIKEGDTISAFNAIAGG